jgi:hypothetical protein
MTAGLRALLSGIVDYAGLFPPAKLPLAEAIQNYARYRTQNESWMLGRFVCPAQQLADLAPFHDKLLQGGEPFTFSVLGRGGNTADEFLTGLEADLDLIARFRERHQWRVTVDVFEVKWPAQGPASPDGIRDLLSKLALTIERAGPPALTPFIEVSPGDKWKESLATAIQAIKSHNDTVKGLERCRPAGFKLRTGGLVASAFPSTELVAYALYTVSAIGVAFKATAGLHHPLGRFDPTVQAKMHGFLNVFGALVLASARGLEQSRIQAILEDEDPRSFVFGAAGFRWHDLEISVAEIAKARREIALSFGSCSFDEPREDLAALGFHTGESLGSPR